MGSTPATARRVLAVCAALLLAGTRGARADSPADANGTDAGQPSLPDVVGPPAPPAPAARALEAESTNAGSSSSKPIAAATVGAIYGAFGTWAYFAWFHNRPQKDFSVDYSSFQLGEYAGGADKLGHFWANNVLSRWTTAVLVRGGWRRLPSSLVASGISLAFFTLSELKDSFVYSFEVGDEIANAAGAAFSLLMVNVPELDRLLDFRVEYVPSPLYRRSFRKEGNLDLANDYTGQSYMLALHLDAVPRVTDPPWMNWARYADVVVGFETRHFSPIGDGEIPRQTLYAGIAINMQHLLRRVFPCDTTGRQIAHGAVEVLSVPYTTLPIGEFSRQRDAPIPAPP